MGKSAKVFCSDEDKASCEALKVALNSNYLDPITESGAGGGACGHVVGKSDSI